MKTASTPVLPGGGRPGFWRRRIVNPVIALLTQGVTPEQLARTIGVSVACSLFPLLGLTTLLNLGVGLKLRMNQPVMQAINQLLTPLHLVMIVVYVRTGEWMLGADAEPFTLAEMLRTLRQGPWSEFWAEFGEAGLHALLAWFFSAPLWFAVIYFPLRPLLHRLARRSTARATAGL